MIHGDLDLFYDTCNAISAKQIRFLFIDFSKPFLYFYERESKSSSIILFVLLRIISSML